MAKIKGYRRLTDGRRVTDGVEFNIPKIKKLKRIKKRRRKFDMWNPFDWILLMIGLVGVIALLILLFWAIWKFVAVMVGILLFVFGLAYGAKKLGDLIWKIDTSKDHKPKNADEMSPFEEKVK
jgi:flagellar biogenesis protein FliO